MEKIKVLMLVNYIPHYRLPVYNKIAEHFNLTIAHFGSLLPDKDVNFKQIKLTEIQFRGFVFFKENLYKICQNYDVVLSLSDLRVLPKIALGLRRKRNFGLVYWGIGVSASYNKKFDEDKRLDKIRFWLINKADAILFYSSYPIKRYIDYGIDSEKLFVAHNTIEVKEKIDIPNKKKYFLFVGTLYTQKKIYDLLQAYLKYKNKNKNIADLIIVGDGEERENIIKWINNNNLEHKIFLKGQINDQNTLRLLYQDAIACISPGQAGLTVLNSFAYGVPFITTKDAITGGEIFNIIDQETGIFYDGSINNLAEILGQLNHNTDLVNILSKNAQNHYFNYRTIDNMVNGFIDAINFAYNKHVKI